MGDTSRSDRGGDPAFGGAFVLEVDSLTIGTFAEVTGLMVEIAVEEIVEGGYNESTHKVPGAMKFSNITFKRGVIKDNCLLAWLQACAGEKFEKDGYAADRRDASIHLLDPHGKPVRTWLVQDVFPVRWKGPELAASSTAIASEELEVTHGGFRSA